MFIVLLIVTLSYYPPRISKAQAPVLENKIEYDGNTIQQDVIIKPNIPTTDEELAQARAYDKEQKRIAEAKRLAIIRRSTTTNLATSNGFNLCSCVSYARWKTGINVGPIGLAKRHPINHTTPVVGAIGVMRYGASAAGHLFAVEAVEANRMYISEGNWVRCRQTSRWVNLDYGDGFYY